MWMRGLPTCSLSLRVAATATTAKTANRRLFTTARRCCPQSYGQEPRDNLDSQVWILATAAAAAAAVAFLGGGITAPVLTRAESKNAAEKVVAFQKNVTTCLPHRDAVVLTNTKNGRTIVLAGAVNYSAESSEFVASLVKQLKPQAVFIDINEHVFQDFGIRSRVEELVGKTTNPAATTPTGNLWKNLMLLPQVEGDLAEIADASNSTMFSSALEAPVNKSIQAVFGQLRFAGVESGDKVDSWTHIVRTLQEGVAINADIVLGGRDHAVGVQRGDEAMLKSNRKAAADLVYLIRPTWKDDLPPRLNFKAVRQIIRDKLPVFEQVVLQELDVHTARKLHVLEQYPCIVAVVMMIHLNGVEEELKKLGWVTLQML